MHRRDFLILVGNITAGGCASTSVVHDDDLPDYSSNTKSLRSELSRQLTSNVYVPDLTRSAARASSLDDLIAAARAIMEKDSYQPAEGSPHCDDSLTRSHG